MSRSSGRSCPGDPDRRGGIQQWFDQKPALFSISAVAGKHFICGLPDPLVDALDTVRSLDASRSSRNNLRNGWMATVRGAGGLFSGGARHSRPCP